jgi:hypothetical protein
MCSRCTHLPENEPPASVVVGIEATATKQVYLAYPTVSNCIQLILYLCILQQMIICFNVVGSCEFKQVNI